MRIETVDIWTVVVPTLPGTVSSPEWPDEVLDGFGAIPKQIIRLRTNDGATGIGETNRGVSRGEVDACAAALTGQDPERLPLMQLPLPRNGAYDAFEMAVFDLLGRVRGVPVWSLLGGKYHDEVPVDYWMGLVTPDEAERRVERGLALGFTGIKTKCKLEQPVVEIVRRVKAAAPDWTVTIDPNQRFHRPAATLDLARRLSDLPGLLFESPVPQNRLDWYRRLRDTSEVPIALHLGNVDTLIPALEQGCADVYNLNGSMTEFVVSTRAAAAAGCPVWHGSGNDLGIRDASFVHACAATPAELHPSDMMGHIIREHSLCQEWLPMVGGRVSVPTSPGLGVELDEAAVARFQVV